MWLWCHRNFKNTLIDLKICTEINFDMFTKINVSSSYVGRGECGAVTPDPQKTKSSSKDLQVLTNVLKWPQNQSSLSSFFPYPVLALSSLSSLCHIFVITVIIISLFSYNFLIILSSISYHYVINFFVNLSSLSSLSSFFSSFFSSFCSHFAVILSSVCHHLVVVVALSSFCHPVP